MRRARLDEIPEKEHGGKVEVFYKVEPKGDRWIWEVWAELKYPRPPLGRIEWIWMESLYSEGGGWRRPGPHRRRGRCRTQEKAAMRARLVVEDARRRVAQREIELAQALTTRVPL